jgi:hypothetical protein
MQLITKLRSKLNWFFLLILIRLEISTKLHQIYNIYDAISIKVKHLESNKLNFFLHDSLIVLDNLLFFLSILLRQRVISASLRPERHEFAQELFVRDRLRQLSVI